MNVAIRVIAGTAEPSENRYNGESDDATTAPSDNPAAAVANVCKEPFVSLPSGITALSISPLHHFPHVSTFLAIS